MAQLIVRNIDEEVKDRLKARAHRHGRSLEAEVRDVLAKVADGEEAPQPTAKEGLGTRLARILGNGGLTKEEWGEFEEALRDAGRESNAHLPEFGK